MVKRKPEDLLTHLFDIYAVGAHEGLASRGNLCVLPSESIQMTCTSPTNLSCPSSSFFQSFQVDMLADLLILVIDSEQTFIEEQLIEATHHISPSSRIPRPTFRTLLLNNRF